MVPTMTRLQALIAGLLVVGSAAAVFAVATASGAHENAAAQIEARSVVAELFQTLNERRYDQTCALFSPGCYRENRVRNPRECAIGLRIGLMWSQEIHFRITAVSLDGEMAVVDAVVDGAPGRIISSSRHRPAPRAIGRDDGAPEAGTPLRRTSYPATSTDPRERPPIPRPYKSAPPRQKRDRRGW